MLIFRVQAAQHAKHVYETRLQSELEARSLHPSRNRLLAASLHDLLEDRKQARNAADLERLARRYEVDVEKLESIARYVNTPAVDPSSVKRVLKEDGSEVTTMKVRCLRLQHVLRMLTRLAGNVD